MTSCRVLAILILLLVTGCNSSGVWFATTRMEMTDYRTKKVVILPVVVLQDIKVNEDVKSGLQKAVVSGLSAFHVRVKDVRIVSEAELAQKEVAPRFPWTPARVAAAAAALDSGSNTDTAGAIGISITGTAERLGDEPAALSVMFVFADKLNANERRWAMAGTWSDKRFNLIVDDVARELGSYFINLKWVARTGDKLLVDEQYDPNQPFVTVFGRQGIFADQATTDDNHLRLQVTGIHDNGIKSIQVKNERAHFSVKLEASFPTQTSKGPIYYSNYVNIPLAFGVNEIRVSAQATNGEATQRRPIKIQRTSRPGLRSLSVGVSDYDSFNPVRGASDSAQRVHSLLEKAPGTLAAMQALDKLANREAGDHMLDEMQRTVGVDDQVVFYFAGRLVSVLPRIQKEATRFYLALSDASPGSPGLGSFSTQDVSQLLLLPSSVAVIDVCSSEMPNDVDLGLQQALPRNAVFRVTSCNSTEGLGGLSRELERWWKTSKSKTNLAGAAAWIENHVPGALHGESRVAIDEDGASTNP